MLVQEPIVAAGGITRQLAILSQRCPHGHMGEDCPLHSLRRLQLGNKVRMLHRLSEAQQRAIYKAHLRCPHRLDDA
jgi:hypothetical protein